MTVSSMSWPSMRSSRSFRDDEGSNQTSIENSTGGRFVADVPGVVTFRSSSLQQEAPA
jgi:hypothetical protein